jgi:hypothetical protein
MSMRSTSRRAAALIAGAAIASMVMAEGAAASLPRDEQPTPQRQAGVPAGAFAPTAVDPASEQAPGGAVSPRSHRFKHCGNRRVCIFRGANYRIWKVTFGARFAGAWRWILISDGVALRHYSAKNRFNNRRLLLRGTRANGTWRRYCLNPRTNRRGPLGPGMLQFKIGRAGSRC